VADILQKATESVPAEQINSNTHLKGLFEGLKMTEAELHKVNFLKMRMYTVFSTN
jgi:molecular chaperone GrpE